MFRENKSCLCRAWQASASSASPHLDKNLYVRTHSGVSQLLQNNSKKSRNLFSAQRILILDMQGCVNVLAACAPSAHS